MSTWDEFLALDEYAQAREAVNVLRDVVEPEKSDYVYSLVNGACVYVTGDNDDPSCLIGHALIKLGCPAESLRALGAVCFNRERLGIHKSTAAIWAAAQAVQDDQRPWGDAVRTAENVYNALTVK